jgi:hypothetical protein
MTNDFPLDDTGEVLRNMKAQGVDFSKEHQVDFFLAFDDIDAAMRCAQDIEKAGAYQLEVYRNEENGGVDVTASKRMLLDHHAISQAERELDDVARVHGGFADGWGTLQD